MAHVALTTNGRHLHLGIIDGRRLRTGTAAVDPSAIFERVELGHGRIALRTLDGRYLAARPDDGLNYGIYPEDELSPAAAFEEILWPDGQVSLRSCHLTYVAAAAAGPVTVNRVEPGPEARFRLVAVAPSFPAQRRPVREPAATAR